MDKLLQTLGLNSREAKLYKAVVKTGSVSPAALAKLAGVKRTTAYAIARALVEKGLLVEDSTKRPRVFLPASPKHVESLITDERMRLAEREKTYKELAGELSRAAAGKTYPVPQIRFIPEEKLEQFQSTVMDEWRDSVMRTDKTWWGFQDHAWVDTFGHLIEEYWKQAPQDLHLKFLSNREGSPAELKMIRKFPRRVIKYWDKATNFLSSLWVVGDYVVILNTRRHPFYLVEIHDATFAHDMREVFKNLWPLV